MRISSARSRLGAKLISVASISLTLLGNVHGQGSLDFGSDIPKSELPRSSSMIRLLCRTINHSKIVIDDHTTDERYDPPKNMTVEINLSVPSVTVLGIGSDESPVTFDKTSTSESEIAASTAKKDVNESSSRFVLNRVSGEMKLTTFIRFASRDYGTSVETGVCKVLGSRKF